MCALSWKLVPSIHVRILSVIPAIPKAILQFHLTIGGGVYCRYMILHEYSGAGSIEWNLRRKCHAITHLCNQCFQPVHVIISLNSNVREVNSWKHNTAWSQQLDVSLGVMLIVKKGQTMFTIVLHWPPLQVTVRTCTPYMIDHCQWKPTCSIHASYCIVPQWILCATHNDPETQPWLIP